MANIPDFEHLLNSMLRKIGFEKEPSAGNYLKDIHLLSDQLAEVIQFDIDKVYFQQGMASFDRRAEIVNERDLDNIANARVFCCLLEIGRRQNKYRLSDDGSDRSEFSATLYTSEILTEAYKAAGFEAGRAHQNALEDCAKIPAFAERLLNKEAGLKMVRGMSQKEPPSTEL